MVKSANPAATLEALEEAEDAYTRTPAASIQPEEGLHLRKPVRGFGEQRTVRP